MNNKKLGWAGLGNMGIPMSKNLIRAGFPVTVYNRTADKATSLLTEGAQAASSPAQLSANVDIIFIMVANDDAVKEIFLGKEGLLSVPVSGKLFIDMSTVSPETSKFIAQECKDRNAAFLDAPVSGSVKPAEDATLIIMAGGEEDYLKKATPFLQKLGKKIIHLGPNGSGSSAKLSINYFLAVYVQGLAETVLFAQQQGIPAQQMLEIINEGALGTPLSKIKSPAIINNNFPAAFALKLLLKDLTLAGNQGLDLPLFAPIFNSFQDAVQQGLGEKDMMAIIQYLETYPVNESKVFNIL